ncbi:hypothetical protein SCALM49S_01739 [Streptomyces californicus]
MVAASVRTRSASVAAVARMRDCSTLAVSVIEAALDARALQQVSGAGLALGENARDVGGGLVPEVGGAVGGVSQNRVCLGVHRRDGDLGVQRSGRGWRPVSPGPWRARRGASCSPQACACGG